MNLAKFLIWCSGSSEEILNRCPESERNRQIVIGSFILTTSISAFLTSSFAIDTVFENRILSILIGLLWAAIIFNIDKFLVSSSPIKNKENSLEPLKIHLIPRIVLAALLGALIGVPFELYVFDNEIKTEIKIMLLDERNDLLKKFETDYTQKLNDAENASNSRKEKAIESRCGAYSNNMRITNEAIQELDKRIIKTVTGEDGTGPGCGPRVCKGLERELSNLKSRREDQEKLLSNCSKELNDEIDRQLKTKKDDLLKKLHENEGKIQDNNYTSLLTRIRALERLSKNDNTIFVAKWALTFLFIFIEVIPVLTKFAGGLSIHDLYIYQEKSQIEIATRDLRNNLEHSLEKQSIKLQGEKIQLRNEWKSYEETYDAFLNTLNKSLQDKIDEILQKWFSEFEGEDHFSSIEAHFKQQLEKFLENFSSFMHSSYEVNSKSTHEDQPNTHREQPSFEGGSNKSTTGHQSDTETNKGDKPHWVFEETAKAFIGKLPDIASELFKDPKAFCAAFGTFWFTISSLFQTFDVDIRSMLVYFAASLILFTFIRIILNQPVNKAYIEI